MYQRLQGTCHAAVLLFQGEDTAARNQEAEFQTQKMVACHLPLQLRQPNSLPLADPPATAVRAQDDVRGGGRGWDLAPGLRVRDGMVRLPAGDDMRHGQGFFGPLGARQVLRVLRLPVVHDDGEIILHILCIHI